VHSSQQLRRTMRISNETKHVAFPVVVREMKHFSEKLLGLLYPGRPEAVYFRARFGIHTFFMKHPIDVLVLDHDFRIVAIRHSLRPWRFFFWSFRYSRVLELPIDSIQRSGTELGDKLELIR